MSGKNDRFTIVFPTQLIQLYCQGVKSVALFPVCRLDDVSLGKPTPDLLLQVRRLHGGLTAVNKGFPGEKTQPVDIGKDAESDEEILGVEDVPPGSLHLLS